MKSVVTTMDAEASEKNSRLSAETILSNQASESGGILHLGFASGIVLGSRRLAHSIERVLLREPN